jgi:hypothetical protein
LAVSIKITPADKYFSLCVRERAEWTCEHCKKELGANAQNLHCSHIFSRRHPAIRHEPRNAAAHCAYCHRWLTENPVAFGDWAVSVLGREVVDLLRERIQRPYKRSRTELKEIAAHYRAQHKEMLRKRAEGHTGRLEFRGFS